jgi:guanylate kinase
MRPGTLYVISAPSGAGKSSLIDAYLQGELLGPCQRSISHTTRPKRPGEIDGEHYHFVDTNTFNTMVAQGEFIEHAKVFDHNYGTSRKIVESTLAQGGDVFLDIDWQGARQVREKIAEICTIFILPPSRRALEQRLRQRAQDSEEVVARRMITAVGEMSHHHEYDYLIINDDFQQALADLKAVIYATHLQYRQQQSRYQSLLRKLLATAS